MPKLFISYSWTNPIHEEWVLSLATELVESGIETILDKWDLKEGHDANSFMEMMVNDPEVTKVLLICDEAYVKKANGRHGGVGTEAQIISAELYSKQKQDKFVAVVRERDEEGRPYLPTYYHSRIYIDLSSDSQYAENFERLIRWAYDQPLYQKPQLGKKPQFLEEQSLSFQLLTSVKYRRAIDAMKNGRSHAEPAIDEYLSAFAEEMEKIRIIRDDMRDQEAFEKEVIRNIEIFTPYRDEFISVISTAASYRDNEDTRYIVHKFFESVIPMQFRPENVIRYYEGDFDNYRFIIRELFLLAVSTYIKIGRFQSANYLLRNGYYCKVGLTGNRTSLQSFRIFDQGVRSLVELNRRNNVNYHSSRAYFLKERCKGVGVDFRHIMQTDFILWIRNDLYEDDYRNWYPDTLVYAERHSGAYEIFARSRSRAYFEDVKPLLAVNDLDELKRRVEQLEKQDGAIPRWEFNTFRPRDILGLEQIGTT